MPKTYYEKSVEMFDKWYSTSGHWIYASRAEAMIQWLRRGIEGLPTHP